MDEKRERTGVLSAPKGGRAGVDVLLWDDLGSDDCEHR
jgi:hypothetical protein